MGRLPLGVRILIADDHESVLRRVRGTLEAEPGWKVCGEAVSGRDAIAEAARLKPDLVILDFAMPQLDGLKTASEISTLLADVPIIMYTMYGSLIGREANKHGIARVVDKSDLRALIAAVKELLGTDRQQPSLEAA